MTKESLDFIHKVSGRMSGLPIRRFGLLFAALVSVSSYPALFVYFHNIGEAVFAQVFQPILIFMAVGLAAWLLFGLLSLKMSKGACVALVFLLVFMKYSLIEDGIMSLVPAWRWWRIAPAFLFLFINLALMLRLLFKRPGSDAFFTRFAVIIGGVFLALTLFNAACALYSLAAAQRVESSPAVAGAQPAEEVPAVSSAGNRPNFYFFIFDEYARQDMLQKYAGYDNTPFLKGLEHRRFNVSYSSSSTASITQMAIANLWHYSFKYKTGNSAMSGLARPLLFDVFKKAGYKVYGLSPYSLPAGQVDVILKPATAVRELSVEQTVLAQSFLDYFSQSRVEFLRTDKLGLLQRAADIMGEPAEQPKFMFFHLLCPHEPFLFDENGGPVALESTSASSVTRAYIQQLNFVSKKIHKLANIVIEKDPQAVVLMQSDHGARFFNGMQEEEKLACLNVLYAGGQPVDIEGLSSINTLRLALNHALGLKLKLELLRAVP